MEICRAFVVWHNFGHAPIEVHGDPDGQLDFNQDNRAGHPSPHVSLFLLAKHIVRWSIVASTLLVSLKT